MHFLVCFQSLILHLGKCNYTPSVKKKKPENVCASCILGKRRKKDIRCISLQIFSWESWSHERAFHLLWKTGYYWSYWQSFALSLNKLKCFWIKRIKEARKPSQFSNTYLSVCFIHTLKIIRQKGNLPLLTNSCKKLVLKGKYSTLW